MMRRGYTMVEIIVVIGIIGILAGIAWPVTTSFMGRARENVCLQNLNAIGAGLQQYLQDNGDRLPSLRAGRESKSVNAPVMDTELLDYVGNVNLFHCPSDSKEFKKTGSSYFWNSALNGMLVNEVSFFGISNSPELIPLISDKESWHPNETNFLYADSSISNKIKFATSHQKK